jgi:hypothetical protein
MLRSLLPLGHQSDIFPSCLPTIILYYHLSHACYMPHPSHYHWFYHANTIWEGVYVEIRHYVVLSSHYRNMKYFTGMVKMTSSVIMCVIIFAAIIVIRRKYVSRSVKYEILKREHFHRCFMFIFTMGGLLNNIFLLLTSRVYVSLRK